MFESKKFRILEVIINNRQSSFDVKRVELMKEFPEMSWEEITDYILLLKAEGYVQTLFGDNELCAVDLQRGALARVQDLRETSANKEIKELLGKLISLIKISI